MSKVFLQKLRMAASEADDLLTSCDASDLLDGLEVARDFMFEAASMIEELESQLAQVERERNSLLDYLGDSTCAPCDICKHDVGSGVMGCKRIREIGIPCFEWRGVGAENTEEE